MEGGQQEVRTDGNDSPEEARSRGRDAARRAPGGARSRTRSGRTTPKERSGSAPPSTRLESPQRKRAKRGRCPLPSERHGQLVDGRYVCHACGEENWTGWNHLQDTGQVEEALAWWSSAVKRSDSCVREEYVPNRNCVCARKECFFKQWKAWKDDKAKRQCSICLLRPREGNNWHHPGGLLVVLSAWFRSGNASIDTFLKGSTDLSLASDICKRCYMEGYNNRKGAPW